MAYALYINSTLVFNSAVESPPQLGGAAPLIALDYLARSFDGPAELAFKIINTWQQAGWSADSDVRLERDGVVIFRGLLELPGVSVTAGGGPMVQYKASDRSKVRRNAVTANNVPAIHINPGTLQGAVNQLLVHIAPTLTEMGISTTVAYSAGAASIQCLPLDLNGKTITEAMRMLAQNAPGVRVFLDPSGAQDAFRFIPIYAATRRTITLDSTRLDTFEIQQSLEGRSGAVRTTQRQATGTNNAQDVTQLAPAWDSSLEATWTIDMASWTDPAGSSPSSYVYRRWSFAGFGVPVAEEVDVQVLRVNHQLIPPSKSSVEIESIDFENKLVTLKEPAIKQSARKGSRVFSPVIPGRARAADVYLRYTVGGGASISVPGTRYPASGFSGRAYALAPTTCAYEQIVDVPQGVDHASYATDAWKALSEPVVTGSVPIVGDPPAELLTLDGRISFNSNNLGPTGFETLDAPLQGFRLNFESGVRYELQFSTDRSAMLRGGIG